MGMSSSQLTNSIIFQDGRYTTNQYPSVSLNYAYPLINRGTRICPHWVRYGTDSSFPWPWHQRLGKASNTGLFCAQCSAGDEPGVNKNVEFDDFPMKKSPFVAGFPSHSAEKNPKRLGWRMRRFRASSERAGFEQSYGKCSMYRWFMMSYDDFWWFLMIYDDLWWFLMVYDDFWWFMMVYDDLWWFTMISDDSWWSLRTQRVIVTWTLNGCWINFWHVYSVNLRFSLNMCVSCTIFHGFSEIIFWDHAKWCPVIS